MKVIQNQNHVSAQAAEGGREDSSGREPVCDDAETLSRGRILTAWQMETGSRKQVGGERCGVTVEGIQSVPDDGVRCRGDEPSRERSLTEPRIG